MHELTHLAQIFKRNALKLPDRPAFKRKVNGAYVAATWSEAWDQVLRTALCLKNTGLQPRGKVAIWCCNCPEWIYFEMGALVLGAASVPVYLTLAASEIKYILSDSGARVLVVENTELLEKLDPFLDSLDQLWAVILLQGEYRLKNPKAAQKIISLRESMPAAGREQLDDLDLGVEEDRRSAMASVIYTSGTTGVPKGVVLTHGNFIANILAVDKVIPLTADDIHLSFLPLCHVFERLCGYYLMAYKGATTAYAESMETVPQNLLEVRPTVILGVPRFYEKIYLKINERIRAVTGLKKKLFEQVSRLSVRLREDRRLGRLSWSDRLRWGAAKWLVLNKVKASLGGRIRFCVSGGAPLPLEMAEFFYDLDILIVEGYGLTETSPVIAANSPVDFKFGTVGRPLVGVQVRITPEGEIQTKSASVMQGYYHRDDATREVLRDGWFSTGDLGELDQDGFLKITGRKKEIIVTSSGKKVSSERVEAVFEKSPLITRCVLHGEGRPFLTALIVPADGAFSGDKGPDGARDRIQRELDRIHTALAPFEQIKYFHVLKEDFTLERRELTPTMKLRREVIFERYAKHLLPYYEAHDRAR